MNVNINQKKSEIKDRIGIIVHSCSYSTLSLYSMIKQKYLESKVYYNESNFFKRKIFKK
jgi:hypothetical protein